METFELKICYYLDCESHTHLGVLRGANAKSEHNSGRFVEFKHVTTARMRNVGGAMGVFTRSVLSIPSGKIFVLVVDFSLIF